MQSSHFWYARLERLHHVAMAGFIVLQAWFPVVARAEYVQPTPPQGAAPAVYQAQVVSVATGTRFTVVMSSSHESQTARVGDKVVATLPMGLTSTQGTVVLPQGTQVMGTITQAVAASRLSQQGQLGIHFTSAVLPNKTMLSLSARVVTTDGSGILKAKETKAVVKDNAKNIAIKAGIGALAGAAGGAIFGGKPGKGAIAGAAIGGGIGLGQTAFRRGDDIVLPTGMQLDVMLDAPLTINP
ncbi:MAG: hypothetical protein ACKO37_00370 [Vampirovibrionales bacterium]